MSEDTIRTWLVERTYSDDEQNIIILTYATPDGTRYVRKERALPSFTGPAPAPTAATAVSPADLTPVEDPDLQERYAREAERMRDRHDPDETI